MSEAKRELDELETKQNEDDLEDAVNRLEGDHPNATNEQLRELAETLTDEFGWIPDSYNELKGGEKKRYSIVIQQWKEENNLSS